MRISKKLIIFILLLLITITVGYLLYKKSKTPTQYPFKPNINSFIQTTPPITSQLSEQDFKFPSSLPTLEISSKNYSFNDFKNIAKKIGFNEDPQTVNDTVNGTLYVWSQGQESLIINPTKKHVAYYNSQTPSKNRVKPEAAIQNAIQFVNQKSPFNLEYSFITFVKENQGGEGLSLTTSDLADLYQINFSLKSTGQKIINDNPFSSPFFVSTNPDGQIVSFGLTLLGDFKKSQANYPIKNYNQVISTLKEAKVVSLDDGNIINPDTNAHPFQNVTASEIDLGYLINSANVTVAQPVFIIKGTATLKDYPQNLSAFMYLPAIATPQVQP